MNAYPFSEIEAKWQAVWEEQKTFRAVDFSKLPKWYTLVEFPYPSGDGLHTGHVRSYTAMDILSRKRRMQGYNVLYPMGWDAFGLPTENYAIKTGVHPSVVTKNNTDNFRRQLKALGLSIDWDREINTTDPMYYKWTQWIFLKLFENGLAYKKEMKINWCPSCKTGLANEEVVGGNCERCGAPTEKRDKAQWMLAITKYADRLYQDLDQTEFLEQIKIQQRNWIGPSTGSKLEFQIVQLQGSDPVKNLAKLAVFTTRIDTLFGATYMVAAPDLPLIKELLPLLENQAEVVEYINRTAKESEIERAAEDREKTGVELKGILAVNPINRRLIPVFIADYVLADYGTGAIMAVPCHDKRDYGFATKFGLPIEQVIAKPGVEYRSFLMGGKQITNHDLEQLGIKIEDTLESGSRKITIPKASLLQYEQLIQDKLEPGFWNEYVGFETVFLFKSREGEFERIVLTPETNDQIVNRFDQYMDYEEGLKQGITMLAANDWYQSIIFHQEYGVLINSGEYTGLTSEEAIPAITKAVGGELTKSYKLRDWVFSRQHYWGEPIPMINCPKCGFVPVPETDLPVELPQIDKYQPTNDGESPLSAIRTWVETTCPKCGGPSERETDTMPNWAGSSWYFLRYLDPHNQSAFCETAKLKYWGSVDWYNGGSEHTTLHLLYSRFWNKFLFDLGLVPNSEPYQKRTSQGMILGEGGVKMSKSKGNVVNPDGVVKEYGADTLRVYEMFMGPFDQSIAWDTKNIAGCARFLNKVWNLGQTVSKDQPEPADEALLNRLIDKISTDIERLSFNTSIAQFMSFTNEFEKRPIPQAILETFLILLSPFVPHLTAELWSKHVDEKSSVHQQSWPQADPLKLVQAEVEIVIQVNGKVRERIKVGSGSTQEVVTKLALANSKVQPWISNQTIKKQIFIPDRLLNLVV